MDYLIAILLGILGCFTEGLIQIYILVIQCCLVIYQLARLFKSIRQNKEESSKGQ